MFRTYDENCGHIHQPYRNFVLNSPNQAHLRAILARCVILHRLKKEKMASGKIIIRRRKIQESNSTAAGPSRLEVRTPGTPAEDRDVPAPLTNDNDHDGDDDVPTVNAATPMNEGDDEAASGADERRGRDTHAASAWTPARSWVAIGPDEHMDRGEVAVADGVRTAVVVSVGSLFAFLDAGRLGMVGLGRMMTRLGRRGRKAHLALRVSCCRTRR
jgi:hypothetical protein